MAKKPTPSKKQAPSSTGSRRSTWAREQRKKLQNQLVLEKCPQTGETKRRHFASPSGHYQGRQVFQTSSGSAPLQEIEA